MPGCCATMNKDYTPIGCELYSEYELLILRKKRLRLHYQGPGKRTRIETLLPVNLRTRSKGEYLIARSPNGITRVLRLDRIRGFNRHDEGVAAP